jgi:hypothetical protein
MKGATITPSPWMTTAEAAAYTKRPTRAAFREWARRHGVVSASGLVDRRDIDAALAVAQRRKQHTAPVPVRAVSAAASAPRLPRRPSTVATGQA